MLQYREDSDNGIVEITIETKITQEDFNRVAGQMEAFINAHGKIKILEEIRHFSGCDASVLWEGIKFDMKHLKHYSHCAVVCDEGWVGPIARAAGAMISCKVRVFPPDQIDEARQWLKSPDA
jgi:hypothetical protein